MKVHESEKSVVVALCDKGLIGKVLEEGDIVLDLKNYAYFYKGKEVGEAEAKAAIGCATSLNLVGIKSVALGEKLGWVKKRDVRKIGGVPHAQAYII
ncbi:Uncharacterised protein [uncultured archaeon]|nr:Uncharacterised protein [uncultured archaeon]